MKSASELIIRYEKIYGEPIDVRSCCLQSFIMKYDERLITDAKNERMKLQKGAFAVCGADVSRLPERTVVPFETLPTRTFMIPAGFKASIQKELKDIGVQAATVYPEAYSTLARIKAELDNPKEEIDLESSYEVVENSGIRNKVWFKDLEIQIKLTRPLDNESVKQIVRIETQKFTDKVDVVWTYIANCDTDVQINNWRLRGKWIRKGMELQKPLRENDEDGFSWDVTAGSVIHSLWMQEYGFGDDKIELCKYIKAFKLIQPEIEKVREYAKGEAEKPTLNWCSKAMDVDVLYAGNQAMDELFQSFEIYFADAAVVNLLVNKEDQQALSNELRLKVIPDEKKIEDQLPYWLRKLGITKEEVEAVDPFQREKTSYNFKQTIPMGKNPLVVSFDVAAKVNKEGRAEIMGSTNLFDGANLMVELDRKATGKPIVKDGSFTCILGAPGSCHVGDRHMVTIILPMPSVQPLDFVKKAGMEYENLDGDFIKREGIGVSGLRDIEVILE